MRLTNRISKTRRHLRQYATRKADKGKVTIDLSGAGYKLHGLEKGESPATKSETTRDELLGFFREMSRMRRLEIAADTTYKQKLIRGFLHLYNGQEAVAAGLEASMTPEDHAITAYRCHAHLVTKRCDSSIESILAELFGKDTGCSKGKGGSMHMYNFDKNFYGGNGIVGAQMPLGTGIGFSQKYLGNENISYAYCGDGAANQGQLYESFNLAAIHKLPVIFVIENNEYGMGTSVARASAISDFYTRGCFVPGIQFNGMDVLVSKEVGKFAKEYALSNGPILLEAKTYRFKGHSMSDPGTTYRTRDEVDGIRGTSDPILLCHHYLVEHNLATDDELKAITKEVKDEVNAAVKRAKAAAVPEPKELFTDVLKEDSFVRATELVNSHNLSLKPSVLGVN